MLFKNKHIGTFFATVLLLANSAALMAAPAEKEGHLIITEVSVDYETSSMVIIGYDLDFGDGPLAVILGDTDISADCALDLPLTEPQTISCDSLVLPVAADLLLVVSNGDGAPQIDEYDLTFGAVGPAGVDGNEGASCSITECVAPGEATITCGIDSVLVPCIPPPPAPLLTCPCWDTLTEHELLSALNATPVDSARCRIDSRDYIASDRTDDDPYLAVEDFGGGFALCTLLLPSLGIAIGPIPDNTGVCVPEAAAVIPLITWCDL
jgi:hypothetical protein